MMGGRIVVRRKIDFTGGNITHSLIMFSIPIIFGELLQNLYNSVDAIVVGRLISGESLAAVTVCGTISSLIVNFFNGFSVGSNVVIARTFGVKDSELLRRRIQTAFTFFSVAGSILSVCGICAAPFLLNIAGTKPEYYAEALTYLRIYLFGVMFTVIYNSGAGILRAIGDTSAPFRILAASCALNIGLDFLFVGIFRFGIAGVGAATIISQGISALRVYFVINKAICMRCFFTGSLKYGDTTIRDILSVGVAAGAQSAVIGFSNLFVVCYMNLFDTAAVAGIGIAQRLDKFIALPVRSFGITMTTYVGQNLGAEQYDRIKKGKNRCLALGLGITVALCVFVALITEQCVALFSEDSRVIAVGTDMLRMMLPWFFIMAFREVYTGILRGYQKTLMPTILILAGMVGVRQVFLAVMMRTDRSIQHIYECYPIAWAAATIFLLIYYLRVKECLIGLSGEAGRTENGRAR